MKNLFLAAAVMFIIAAIQTWEYNTDYKPHGPVTRSQPVDWLEDVGYDQ